jgi:hypothetical protein
MNTRDRATQNLTFGAIGLGFARCHRAVPADRAYGSGADDAGSESAPA